MSDTEHAEAERQRQEEAERQRQEQEAEAERQRQEQGHAATAAAEPAAAPPPPVEESPQDAAARRLGTRGAQVVLDPESEAAMAAKGGVAPHIEGNTLARDEALLAMGLVPTAPSGDVLDMTEEEKQVHVMAATDGEPTPHLEAQRTMMEREDAQREDMRRAAAEGRPAPAAKPSGAF